MDNADVFNLNDLAYFVAAAETGSFAAAGRRLGAPKSTVSKRISELEAALGARLIHRTTRSFSLTDVGRDALDHARAAVIEAEAAETVVRSRLAEPSGPVSITASVPTAQGKLATRLPSLARAFPKLEIRLNVTDRFVDLVRENVDIAVRSHFAPLPDSALLQRVMDSEPIILVAAPAYIAERGAPERPEDIDDHDGLMADPASTVWRLADGRGGSCDARPRVRLVADESVVLLAAARSGLGVARLPRSIAAEDLAAGSLVRTLPPWTAGVVTTTLLTPHRRSQLPAIRAVLDFLADGREGGPRPERAHQIRVTE